MPESPTTQTSPAAVALGDTVANLGAREKLARLLNTVKGKQHVLVLTHDNPDPDSLASAVALAQLLEKRAGVEATVAYGGIIWRAGDNAPLQRLHLTFLFFSSFSPHCVGLSYLGDNPPHQGN